MPKTIFIIDDSSTILMSVESMLKHYDVTVDKAMDGEAAFAKLSGNYKPDLIITDINMPRMDGIELIGKIRSVAKLRFTPVLVLTTEQEQAKRDQARAKGATGYLVKPLNNAQLQAVLKQVLPGLA